MSVGTSDVRELGHPTAVAVDEKPRLMRLAGFLSFAPHLTLGVLHCRLGVGRGLHVLGLYRLRQMAPQSAASGGVRMDG